MLNKSRHPSHTQNVRIVDWYLPSLPDDTYYPLPNVTTANACFWSALLSSYFGFFN